MTSYLAILWTSFFAYANVVMANVPDEKLKEVADEIVATMPGTWKVIEEKIGVIPSGHHDGLKYNGPRGRYMYLAGDQDVIYRWKDRNGTWHEEPILKEAILLWIMPPEYHQSWKRFFVMKRREPVEEIYSDEIAKVYGKEASYWPPSASDRFKEIESDIATYGSSPSRTVSSWRN